MLGNMKTRKIQNASMKSFAQERVKELACLYGIAKLSSDPDLPLDGVLQGVVALLPRAWQHPDIAQAEIELDGKGWRTPGFKGRRQALVSEIRTAQRLRGHIRVEYARRQPLQDQGPFLKEERQLIDAVARQVAVIVERREAEHASAELSSQLQHADRLATIGVLAAGVAHELNEPLNNILGFAELLAKMDGLPAQAMADVKKIQDASLLAREIITSLLVFARQLPSRRRPMNLNKVVQDSLELLRPRCVQNRVRLVTELTLDLPDIQCDPLHINQVLVNLVVNATQAMPEGGSLLIRTESEAGQVLLTVQDTGCGMNKDTVRRVFEPFFTTKEEGKGTGLGLSIVHEIIKAYGGSIHVESTPGKGTSFLVHLPAMARCSTAQET